MELAIDPAAYVAARLSADYGPSALALAGQATARAERSGDGSKAALCRRVENFLSRAPALTGLHIDLRV